MGTYREIEGDLIKLAKSGEFDMIAHGCNCFKTLSEGTAAGIARVFQLNFPASVKADSKTRYGLYNKLGTLSFGFHRLDKGRVLIINAYTQFFPGKDLDYLAMQICLRKINSIFKNHHKTIGLPLIGCGIAGGDWKMVSKMIKEELIDLDVTIVKLPKR